MHITFKSKITEAEGMKYDGKNKDKILKFIADAMVVKTCHEDESTRKLIIISSDCAHHLKLGDWILKWEGGDGINGYKTLLYVCNNDFIQMFFSVDGLGE